MTRSYYQFPFEPGKITNGEFHSKWNALEEENAIKDYIYLILITRFKELRSSRKFGCGIWETELEIPKKIEVNTWINQIKQSLTDSLHHEMRLSEIKVDIEIEKIVGAKPDDYRKIDVIVSGYMNNLQRKFKFRRTMILNPLSFR